MAAKKLSGKQQKAIAGIMAGLSRQEVAEHVNVTARTIQNWMATNELFIAEMDKRKGSVMKMATARMSGAISLALEYMVNVLQDESVSDSVRLRAANYILEKHVKYLEIGELIPRLEALEEAANVT